MRGERHLLRIGEYLVGRACQRLPRDIREERCREWAAELPAILHDPQIRLTSWRAVRMLSFAADTVRGTVSLSSKSRGRTPRITPTIYLLLLACLGSMAWDIWSTVRAPEHGLNYLQLAWSVLLVAYPVSVLARSCLRRGSLIIISSTLVGEAVMLWNAAHAPEDWVNYFVAALLFAALLVLLRLAWRLPRRRSRTGRA